MKLTKLQKNLLKPILIIASVFILPAMILSDFFGSFLGLRNNVILGKKGFIDKLGEAVFN